MRRLSLSLTLFAASVAATLLVAGCGDDTTATPKCPDLPLFNIREFLADGGASAEAQAAAAEWYKAAQDTECLTPPGDAGVD